MLKGAIILNIDELLKQGKRLLKNVEDGHIKARILLENVLNKSREYIVANSELDVDQNNIDIYLENIDKIKSGMPIQYITNKQEFMKMDFYVNKNVLIPQPDTEILVEEVIKICKEIHFHNKNKKIIFLQLKEKQELYFYNIWAQIQTPRRLPPFPDGQSFGLALRAMAPRLTSST